MLPHRCARVVLLLLLLPVVCSAQTTDPRITSWVTTNSAKYARVYETASDKSSNNAVSTWPRSGLTNGGGGQATPAYSDVQRVAYSTNYVYIYTTGLASYTMGNWLTPNGGVYTSWPANRGAIHRIPRTPSIPTTKQKNNGSGGVLVNGVFVWQNGDAQSYTTSTATVSMSGQGIWNRLAGVAEAFNFDTGYGHQPNSGAYHNHINPIALRYQLGDNVSYNSSTKTYSEAGTPTRHSPIIGWANDGLPIYGPYGYSSAMDATSAIRRMTSGFQKRDGTNGTVNLATTGRTTLPVWAASVQGKSQTLASTEYGPTTTATYQVAPGVTGTYSLGMFAEDYEYLGDLGRTQGVDFDLNRQNVRFCVTPEFPSGTYAYFTCIDASGATVFPDMINQEYFGTAQPGQGTVTSITETVTDYVRAGPAAAITVQASASGSGVALSWNSAEGATYKVESSSDNSTWATLSSSVTSAGTTTSYTATASASYFRVTLTAISTYDTNGTFGTAVGTTGSVTYGAVVSPPTITTQPTGVSVAAGSSATFTIVASGTGLSYQWRKDGTAISSATSASYTILSVAAGDAGSYTCLVTNSGGSVTSSAATLTLTTGGGTTTAPTITTQPANASATAGGSVSFSVSASGTAPLSYQWRKDGAAISGATNATYTIGSVQSSDAGSYSVVVTNTAGSVTSSGATLTLVTTATAPTITTQPTSRTVNAGASTTFSVTAGGTSPLSYQWRKDGTAISGATSATFTIASAQASDTASYTVVITNSAGSVTSSAATLTVNTSSTATAPAITTEPADTTVTTGATATFTVVASGTAPLSYQWRKDGGAISGATSATLTLSNVTSASAGLYSVVVTNAAGAVTSRSARLSLAAGTYAGSYIGSFNGGSFALHVRGDQTGTFLSYAPGTRTTLISRAVTVDALGRFRFTSTSTSSAGEGRAAAATEFTIDGAINADGALSGSMTASGAAFTLAAIKGTANALSGFAGYYEGGAIGASVTTYTVVAVDGRAFLMTVGASGTESANATVDLSGRIAATTSSGTTVNATLSSGTSTLSGTLTSASGTVSFAGATTERTTTEKLMNVSTRGSVGSSSLIAGFVIGGSASKTVLVRAIGPTLQAFGVNGALATPQLEVFRGDTVIARGTAWGADANATAVASAAGRVGAFALATGSRDAALLLDLAPGAYTAVVTGAAGASGVALVEVYDASENSPSAQRLINLATRAGAGSGDGTLIAGFVITGSAPKRVLVRGVGPALTSFGVPGAIADPLVRVQNDRAILAFNNDWSADAGEAAIVSAAAAQAGAFPLANGSRDAALVIYLSPGAYTAQLTGVSGASGAALIEVYEVP